MHLGLPPSLRLAWGGVAVLLLTIAPCAFAHEFRGEVIKVHDGDTITVRSHGRRYSVRFEAIDAPELQQTYGVEARDFLTERLLGKEVRVVWLRRDRNLRRIGTVLLGTRDIGLELVERGCAWHYADYRARQSDEERDRYAAAEASAREESAGLWMRRAPQAPWSYRAEKRNVWSLMRRRRGRTSP